MFTVNIDTEGLQKWARFIGEELPRRIPTAMASALNTVGEQMLRQVVHTIADQTGFDESTVANLIQVKPAGEDDLTWEMDASQVLPPSGDWTRPWDTSRDSDTTFDQDQLVKIVTSEDEKVCPICERAAEEGPYTIAQVKQMHAQMNPYDDSLLHPNCMLPGTAVEGDVVAASKSFYAGRIVKLELASGNCLSLTVNHPVLTAQGFVAAHDLRKGMQLVCDSVEVGYARSVATQNDEDKVPTFIEDVFDTCKVFGAVRKLVTRSDFHGDARCMNNEIEIVTPDRELLRYLVSQGSETGTNLCLSESDVREVYVSGSRSQLTHFQSVYSPSSSFVRGLNLSSALCDGHTQPFKTLRVGLSTQRHSTLFNNCPDRSVASELLRKLIRRESVGVQLDDLIAVTFGETYVGHVYDLQTTSGVIIANGVVISNCRCVFFAFQPTRRLPVTFESSGVETPEQLMTMKQLGQAVSDQLAVILKVT